MDEHEQCALTICQRYIKFFITMVNNNIVVLGRHYGEGLKLYRSLGSEFKTLFHSCKTNCHFFCRFEQSRKCPRATWFSGLTDSDKTLYQASFQTGFWPFHNMEKTSEIMHLPKFFHLPRNFSLANMDWLHL